MDLAEIRKKAKKSANEAPPPPASRPVSFVQGTPSAVSPLAATPAHGSPEKAKQPDVDPLEQLFDGSFDLALATEERYLQGLSTPVAEEGESFRQCLAFTLGNEEYTLDIAHIREIIKPKEITDIPRVPDFVLGIISLRGIIVPVFDLKKRLKLGTAEISSGSRVIVCHVNDRIVGLLVDSITQVVRLPEWKIEPPPTVLTGLDRDLVEGVGRFQGRMMVLLNLPCVMDAQLV